MTKPLLILGCGGHGRVVADAALAAGYDRIAFLDDTRSAGDGPAPFPVIGPIAAAEALVRDWPAAIAALGDNALRLAFWTTLRQGGFATPAVIHPSAVISPSAHVGEGAFVGPAAVINVGARIGEAAIVNTGARIDHDCVVGPGSHIAPGATLSGSVTVGARAWLGTGCAVRQGVTIGDDAVVGVGAAVVSDLAGAATYAGVPARPLRTPT